MTQLALLWSVLDFIFTNNMGVILYSSEWALHESAWRFVSLCLFVWLIIQLHEPPETKPGSLSQWEGTLDFITFVTHGHNPETLFYGALTLISRWQTCYCKTITYGNRTLFYIIIVYPALMSKWCFALAASSSFNKSVDKYKMISLNHGSPQMFSGGHSTFCTLLSRFNGQTKWVDRSKQPID